MKKEIDDEEIIKILQNMPDITDKTSKAELYNRISKKTTYKKTNPDRKKKTIPLLSFSAIFLIILIIVPTMINKKELFSSEHKMKMDYEMTDKSNEQSNTENMVKTRIMSNPTESYVLEAIEDSKVAIYVGLSDLQSQYVIPISLIGENTTDISTHYDQLSFYISENDWGLSDYMFKDIRFEVNIENKETIMVFPEGFKVGDGSSASSHIFEKALNTMFLPYDIEKVVFYSAIGDSVDLGSIGVVKELLIKNQDKVSYKLYQKSDLHRPFLIPIPYIEDMGIMGAFEEMRISEDDFHVYQTIPDDVFFTLDLTAQKLLVRFTDVSMLGDEQEYVTMIEAMLMTAKGYGFESIEFVNTLDHIGPYNLTIPVQVPEAINPIYIE